MNQPNFRRYDMGYTQSEFISVLNARFTSHESGYHCQQDPNHDWLVNQSSSGLQVRISLTPLPDRKLGAFSLPVLKVEFHIISGSTDPVEKFFDRFFKYFHKGGG